MHVFLSVASPERKQAEEVALALRGDGHVVFLDEHDLPVAESYHERIRRAIERADIMVFFISPASISPKRYTLSELKFAQAKWPHPQGRVLPVMVSRTPMDQIPPYLKAVSICTPKGDLAAEVAFEVGRLSKHHDGASGGVWTKFFGGAKVTAGSHVQLPPLIPTMALFAGLGMIAGLVTFALQGVGMSDLRMWATNAVIRGVLFGALLCFMLIYLEFGRARTLALALVAAVAGFLGSDYLLRSLNMLASWDWGTRVVAWGVLRAAIIVGVLSLAFDELRDAKRWGIVLAAALVSKFIHAGMRSPGAAEAALAWAVWDAAMMGALCYVLWNIAIDRQGQGPAPVSQGRVSLLPSRRSTGQRRV